MTPLHDTAKERPDPRRLSIELLDRLDTTDWTLDHLLETTFQAHPDLDSRDRALLHTIVYGVQRWRGRLDWTLAHFAKERPESLSIHLRNLLRVGLFQICFLDRVPAAAAVDTSVRLAKATGQERKAGFVNGLLRNAARSHASVPLPDAETAPDTHLAVTHALPRWLVRRWLKRFGFEETAALGAALTTQPPITVRTNTLRSTPGRLGRALSAVAKPTPSTYTPLAIRLTEVHQPPSSWPAFQGGDCQVQDEAAQLVGDRLNARPGETILDACAGLGGKTGHIGQMMKNRGRILAVDVTPNKLKRLADEMKRLGIELVETCPLDLEVPDAVESLSLFDRILLDAPCSGLGVLRRNPDTKWRRNSKDLPRFRQRQERLLAALAPHLRPGGRLVYAVCSMEPDENEAVIDAFLKSHPDFVIDRSTDGLTPAAAALMDHRGALATFPHRHGMDGFFMVALKRSN
jgi:16S rRNA (cytosine967-C5)-methyltransferase